MLETVELAAALDDEGATDEAFTVLDDLARLVDDVTVVVELAFTVTAA